MKLYKTTHGLVLEDKGLYYPLPDVSLDDCINSRETRDSFQENIAGGDPLAEFDQKSILAPIGMQEVWACGVTYLRSKVGRQEESKQGGGADFYEKVYHASRPEVFFKANGHRVIGPGGSVRIRKDSVWDVPEPELTLVVSSAGQIVGYTIGNDMSSRSIEGENPLYLPQAKVYDGSAALGPCILVTDNPLDAATQIHLKISREKENVFQDSIAISQMKRTHRELVDCVFQEHSFPQGCFIMTGTGIVPGNDFTLRSGDSIEIQIDGIGMLQNHVA